MNEHVVVLFIPVDNCNHLCLHHIYPYYFAGNIMYYAGSSISEVMCGVVRIIWMPVGMFRLDERCILFP